MTGMSIYEALTDIEDQYILDAKSAGNRWDGSRMNRLMIAAAAVTMLLAAGLVMNGLLRKSENGGQ